MEKKKYKIYVFRHGRTEFNVKGLFTGRHKTKLVWRGRKDAKRVAKKLKNVKFQIAIHTSLPRSKETLKYVLYYHPECKKIIVDDRMIERSYGDLEGTTHKQFIKKIGLRSYDLRVEGDAIENLKPNLRKKVESFLGIKEYDAIHRGYVVAAPNGESFLDVEKRVKKFIKWLENYIKKNKVDVAISAHGNSIRLFRKIMEKRSRKDSLKWFIPYDNYFKYEIKI
jgi:bisphosphoglycerate-dependent phosphoglycerate mutase family 1